MRGNERKRSFTIAFTISAGIHLLLQHKTIQCRTARNQPFYSGWFAAAYVVVKYALLQVLMLVRFEPLDIIPHSIAA
ncbi:hypothetical protein I4U23_011793 [Adineta vaga]|nr:hypothetical protein I4U23_011793 [Adineta vaga]